MRILFCICGEGRGHLTQAIAARRIVEEAGHEIVGVVVGLGAHRELPEYFQGAMPVPVTTVSALEFGLIRGAGVHLPATIAKLVRGLPRFARSVRAIARLVRECEPDLVLNFFEPLAGLYALVTRDRPPVVAVGHQFMLEHPAFVRTKERFFQRLGFKWFTRIVGARSTRVALSHYEAPDLPRRRLAVAPPLLRRELFALRPNPRGTFVLVYMVNHGYSEQVLAWHARHPRTVIHCFYDKPEAPPETRVDDTLTFHALDGEKFLRLMAEAQYVVCTAGFESVSEAAYLGKPLLMLPVENHIEQRLNAIDSAQAGLGVWSERFDLDRMAELPDRVDNARYRAWLERSGAVLLRTLEEAHAAAIARRALVDARGRTRDDPLRRRFVAPRA